MSWQKEIRSKIGYWLVGNFFQNIFRPPYFEFLKKSLPSDFLNREICDLGCGDGSATIKLKDLFRAKNIKGYEINDSLIKKARKRGIAVEKIDLEKEVPYGEMATIWAVIHHLKNKEGFLNRVRANFNYAVIVEPIKCWWAFLDGGEPLLEKEWEELFDKTLGGCVSLKFRDNIYIFWKKKTIDEKE